MPRATWTHRYGRPSVRAELTLPDGSALTLDLLVSSGGGPDGSPFDLILEETDCRLCGGQPGPRVHLCGMSYYEGSHPTYVLPVRIPELAFDDDLTAVAVRATPPGFDGIACFRFLERFSYGNFGKAGEFGLETINPSPARQQAAVSPAALSPADEVALVQRLNSALAKRINDEARADPSSPYAGKFVGIANAEVVVVADDMKTAFVRLGEIEPNNRRGCLFEASRDYTKVEYVSQGVLVEVDSLVRHAVASREILARFGGASWMTGKPCG
jgi:hypothetical protein